MKFRPSFVMLLAAACLGGSGVLSGQTAVLDLTYGSTIDGADSSSSDISYSNQYRPVTSITTADGSYSFSGPAAQHVHVRRGAGGPNFTTVVHQSGDGRALGTNAPDIEQLFLSNNLYQGLRNPFANGTTYLDSNIERIDFDLGGYTVREGDGIVLFDLVNRGEHGGGFRIAAYTASDASDRPTEYANTGLLVNPGTYGPELDSPSDNHSREYFRATYGSGDDISGAGLVQDLSGDLGLVGIMIKFTDLGLEVGSTVQGFSIMAGDVAADTAVSLVDWTDSSVYKTNTNRNTWGSTDFMAFGAQIAQPIPEPSTYGAIFMGLLTGLYGWRKYRRPAVADR